jgi:hypothetical protein
MIPIQKTEAEENLSKCHFAHYTNSTLTGLGMNLVLCIEKPVSNPLSIAWFLKALL